MPWDIAGHDAAVAALKAAIMSDQVGHAYMFTGPQGIGKARLALCFAQALLCEETPEKVPCGTCRSCRRVASCNHPDVHWISPQGASLRIDQVRELQAKISLRPYEGRYKLCVLDDADTLTEQAQNSMLKSLEEPPGSGVFILIAHNSGALLPTIHSRCQILHLQPVPEDDIVDLLRSVRNLPADEAKVLAALSDGKPGQALILDPEATLNRRNRVIAWCTSLRQDGLKAVLKIADELEREEDLPGWLTALSVWWRDVWHYYVDPDLPIVNRDVVSDIQCEAQGWGTAAVEALSAIHEARRYLARNANRRLVLDIMLMRIQRGLPS